jgi:ABC-2 type transport system permease protein
MTLEQVVDYVWLGQAMFMIIVLRVDTEVEDMVRTGNVAHDLLRPVNLYGLWFCRAMALRTAPTILRAVPLLLIAYPLLGLNPPASWQAGILFVVSMGIAFVLCSAITVLLTISLIWTISGRGVDSLVRSITWLFSGIVLPLPLYPDWFQGVVRVLPFRGLMDVPFRIYIGHIAQAEAMVHIGSQLAWTIALIAIGSFLLRMSMKRVTIQGG